MYGCLRGSGGVAAVARRSPACRLSCDRDVCWRGLRLLRGGHPGRRWVPAVRSAASPAFFLSLGELKAG